MDLLKQALLLSAVSTLAAVYPSTRLCLFSLRAWICCVNYPTLPYLIFKCSSSSNLDCSNHLLTLSLPSMPVSYSGLHTPSWVAYPPSVSNSLKNVIVHPKYEKSYQAGWQCKMTATWEQDPCSFIIHVFKYQ